MRMIERRGHIDWLHKTLCKYTTFQALVVLWRSLSDYVPHSLGIRTVQDGFGYK